MGAVVSQVLGANRPRTRFPAYRVVIDKQKPNLTQPMANLCCGKITYLVYENIENNLNVINLYFDNPDDPLAE